MATQVGGILGGAALAVEGIRRASDLQEAAAINVQRAFREDSAPSERAGEPATELDISTSARDLATAFTDMMRAEGLNAANVKVLQTADEMTKELTDLKR